MSDCYANRNNVLVQNMEAHILTSEPSEWLVYDPDDWFTIDSDTHHCGHILHQILCGDKQRRQS